MVAANAVFVSMNQNITRPWVAWEPWVVIPGALPFCVAAPTMSLATIFLLSPLLHVATSSISKNRLGPWLALFAVVSLATILHHTTTWAELPGDRTTFLHQASRRSLLPVPDAMFLQAAIASCRMWFLPFPRSGCGRGAFTHSASLLAVSTRHRIT